jgi:nucleoside-diphosphate-sugar epimerase
MKSILITGVAGFLGSHLAERLLKQGQSIIGIDNFSSGNRKRIVEIHSEYDDFLLFDADVRDTDRIFSILNYMDIKEIYHLASPASPKFYQANSIMTIETNTIGTKNMLDLARIKGAKFLFTSTSEAYGDPEMHPQPESYRGNVNTWGPRACYDEAKRLGETYCYEYFTKSNMPIKVVRLFNTYSAGLRNDDGRVISNFVNQALQNKPITVYGDGSQTRSFCYVDDTIEALILTMEKQSANGEIINIGNPVEYSVLQVANMVKDLVDTTSQIVFEPLPQDDPLVRRPVIDKAIKILGWQPTIDLKEGLVRTIEQYKIIDKI